MLDNKLKLLKQICSNITISGKEESERQMASSAALRELPRSKIPSIFALQCCSNNTDFSVRYLPVLFTNCTHYK